MVVDLTCISMTCYFLNQLKVQAKSLENKFPKWVVERTVIKGEGI